MTEMATAVSQALVILAVPSRFFFLSGIKNSFFVSYLFKVWASQKPNGIKTREKKAGIEAIFVRQCAQGFRRCNPIIQIV